MKKKLLSGSAVAALVATGLAIYATLSMNPLDTLGYANFTKLLAVSGYLGLLAVSLFFVGLAAPQK